MIVNHTLCGIEIQAIYVSLSLTGFIDGGKKTSD
jgi:hypothetical protein